MTCLKTIISVLDIHVPLPCLFIHYKMQLSLPREFPPCLLREDKILKLQMQVLGNPRFPNISLHFSKQKVNATRKTKITNISISKLRECRAKVVLRTYVRTQSEMFVLAVRHLISKKLAKGVCCQLL